MMVFCHVTELEHRLAHSTFGPVTVQWSNNDNVAGNCKSMKLKIRLVGSCK
jgi:hypothetical protein